MTSTSASATPPAAEYLPVRCPCCDADDAVHRYDLVRSGIVTCRQCDMSYVNPRVSSAYIEYTLQQWAREDVVDEERLRIAFEPATCDYFGRFLDAIERHRTLQGKKIIDIGCSTGTFLSVARDRGWETTGLELGRASSGYARETLGLDVTQGTLYEAEIPAGSYDAIACIEVIEHLEHPISALHRFHGWLKPDGLLLVSTPNFNSLYRRLFGNRWWVINCEDEHIVLFNLATLTNMLQQAGFIVEYRHIQGLDILGMLKELRNKYRGEQTAPNEPGAAVNDYYEARSGKTGVKRLLNRLGLLRLARMLLRAFSRTYTWRWSPFREWGEQLVVVARRKD